MQFDPKLKAMYRTDQQLGCKASFSAIDTYIDCPRKFYLSYLVKPRPELPTFLGTIAGTAIHEALAAFYKEIKNGHKPSDIEWMMKWAKCKFFEEFDKYKRGPGIRWLLDGERHFLNQAEEDAYAKDKILEKIEIIKILLTKFMRNYYAEECEWLVVGVEEKFEGKIPAGKIYPGIGDVIFKGYIDKIDYNPRTKQYRVVDHKSSTDFDMTKMNTSIQLPLYAYIVSEIFGYPTRAVAYQIFHTKSDRDKDIGIQWQYGDKGPNVIKDLLEQLNMLIPMMKMANYLSPKRPNDNCKFCSDAVNCRKVS